MAERFGLMLAKRWLKGLCHLAHLSQLKGGLKVTALRWSFIYEIKRFIMLLDLFAKKLRQNTGNIKSRWIKKKKNKEYKCVSCQAYFKLKYYAKYSKKNYLRQSSLFKRNLSLYLEDMLCVWCYLEMILWYVFIIYWRKKETLYI